MNTTTITADDFRERAIHAAAKRTRQSHGPSAHHYHVTAQLAPGGGAHHIAVDGRMPMSDKDADDLEDYPELLTEHESRAARDAEAFVHELLSQLAHEKLVVEGLGQHDTNAGDLIAYEFAKVTN